MKLEISNTKQFISEKEINELKDIALECNKALHEKTKAGKEFLGWVDLPSKTGDEMITAIEQAAMELREKVEIVVTIGIGGSYLGAKAVIEALSDNFSYLKRKESNTIVLFAGNNLSEDYLGELRDLLVDKSFGLIVISKSGTTTEPAVAFRILKKDLEERYGKEESRERIIAVTDKDKGALNQLADKENYKTFVIPDDVGGRYSVFTPVGLLPMAVAGFDIRTLIAGAKEMENRTAVNIDFNKNPAAIYAVVRNLFYRKGFNTEILVDYNPKLHYISEWWKQLYGESEGKEGKGIFPASVSFTADLHSMGQYIQDGRRNLFETLISVKEPQNTIRLPEDAGNLDNLNYIAGKRINEINKCAEKGTIMAHLEGGVPNIKIEIPKINEYYIGSILYFFEKACGISGYILGINPFDQPGVEAYKRNMFELLGKPAY